jgi:hypothetical protein
MLATARRAKPIPVFVISRDRGPFLSRTIESIRRLSRPTEIVVLDYGSTDCATLELLAELESAGVAIVRLPANAVADDEDVVDDAVREFFVARGERSRYVVTDGDIDLRVADPEALDVYDELLDRFRNVDCVGPMLRIKDVPREHPLFNDVMNRHVEQFWSHQPSWTQTASGPAAYLECTIDGSFALHRAGERFRRPKKALRVYEPYEALCLGWYSPEISHGNGETEVDNAALNVDRYFTVRRTFSGSLWTYEERLQGA